MYDKMNLYRYADYLHISKSVMLLNYAYLVQKQIKNDQPIFFVR